MNYDFHLNLFRIYIPFAFMLACFVLFGGKPRQA